MTSVMSNPVVELEEEATFDNLAHLYCHRCNGLTDGWPEGPIVATAYCGRTLPSSELAPPDVEKCDECVTLLNMYTPACPKGHGAIIFFNRGGL